MDRHGALSKFLNIEKTIIFLSFILAGILPAMINELGFAQDIKIYREDFNDGTAQGWNLEPGWRVVKKGLDDDRQNYVLQGNGHSWARNIEQRWGEGQFILRFNLIYLAGGVHVNVHVNGPDRYYIGFRTEKDQLLVYLYRQRGEIPPTAALFENRIDFNFRIKHRLEIVTENGNIQVMMEGYRMPVLSYHDPEPLKPGIIAFETLEDSIATIDNIEAIGPSSIPEQFFPLESTPVPVQPIAPKYESGAPDLVILSAFPLNFEKDDSFIPFLVHISNAGNIEAYEIQVYAGDQVNGIPGRIVEVPELGPNEKTKVELRLKIPEEQRGTEHSFLVEVDPNKQIHELNERNNSIITSKIEIPSRNRDIQSVFLASGVLALILSATTVTIRRANKIKFRKRWQESADTEKPPEPCKPCNRYCRKLEPELELAFQKITSLVLKADDPTETYSSIERQIQGEIVVGVNKAIIAHRLKEEPENLKKRLSIQAEQLLLHIKECLREETFPRHISIVGYLEGTQIKCLFVLYHCKQRGSFNVWEEEDKWEAKVKSERSEPIGVLTDFDASKPGISEQQVLKLSQLLMDFIERI